MADTTISYTAEVLVRVRLEKEAVTNIWKPKISGAHARTMLATVRDGVTTTTGGVTTTVGGTLIAESDLPIAATDWAGATAQGLVTQAFTAAQASIAATQAEKADAIAKAAADLSAAQAAAAQAATTAAANLLATKAELDAMSAKLVKEKADFAAYKLAHPAD